MARCSILALLLVWALGGASQAEAPLEGRLAQAQAAYAAGDWRQAETLAGAIDTAAGQALAAQSVLAPLILFETQDARAAAAVRAKAYAERAVALVENEPLGHVKLTVAIGFESRDYGVFGAYRRGLPQAARRHSEAALALDPDDAWALAVHGGWHLEVLRRAGPRRAGWLGASLEEGVAAFEAAMAGADPDQPEIAYIFAVSLIALDGETHRARALTLLDAAATAQVRDAFTQGVVEASAVFHRLLGEDPPAAEAWAIALMSQ